MDANIIVYLVVEGRYTPRAEAVLAHDADWRVPPLWASEVRNALMNHVRAKQLDLPGAIAAMDHARSLLGKSEGHVDSTAVLELAAASGRSCYDCEYIALAKSLGVRLATSDRPLVAAFPECAILPENLG